MFKWILFIHYWHGWAPLRGRQFKLGNFEIMTPHPPPRAWVRFHLGLDEISPRETRELFFFINNIVLFSIIDKENFIY